MNTTQLFYFSLFFCSALVTSGLACSSSNGEEHDIEDWEVCFAFWEELVAMNATNTNDTWVEFAAASGSGSGSGDVSDDQGSGEDCEWFLEIVEDLAVVLNITQNELGVALGTARFTQRIVAKNKFLGRFTAGGGRA